MEQGERRGLGIYAKIFLTMLATALVPLLVVSTYNFVQVRNETTARVNRQLEQVARVLDVHVAGWLDTNVKALQENALLPAIRAMVPARQIPVLRAMAETYNWTYLVSTIGSDGKNVARNDDNPLLDYGDRDYFRQAINGNLGNQVLISKTTLAPALVLAVPFTTDSQSKGVLMTGSDLRDISEAIAISRIGRTGLSILLDAQGHVIGHPVADRSGKLRDLSSHPAYQATRKAQTARVIFTEGDKEFVAYAMTTKLGWLVIVQQETAEAFAPVRTAVRSAAVVVVVAALLVLLVAYLLARGLAAPILQLTRIADAVSRGETNIEIDEVHRGDELGGLARAVDRMRISIDVAMKRLRKL